MPQLTPFRFPARKVLCYSPYNFWNLHGLWEITILQALRLRGAEVKHVLCDGLYSDCDIFWANTAPRHEYSCLECQAKVANLSSAMKMPFEWLGRYLHPEEFRAARQWADSLAPPTYPEAVYNGWPLGEWVRSSLHSHLRLSELNLDSREVQESYRSYLYSGLVAALGLDRLLDDYRPEVLFLFSGRFSSPRVAFELARQRGLRVITHERGRTPESLVINENVNVLSMEMVKDLWRYWGGIPLRRPQLEEISRLMLGRQYGTTLSWDPLNPPPQDLEWLRLKLGLAADRPVWALFTSTEDEICAIEGWGGVYDHQIDWIRETVDFAAQKPQISLVIRVHPYTGGKRATGHNATELQRLETLRQQLPPNVSMIMPDDDISSYSLMDLATVGLVYQSTVGLEMACKGKVVIAAAGSFASGLPSVHTLNSVQEYNPLLETLLHLPAASSCQEIQRLAFRQAYNLFCRANIPFPLVTMPDPHTGALAYETLQDLLPGKEPNLDRVCRIILEGEPVCPPPQASDYLLSDADETAWLYGQAAPQGDRRQPETPDISAAPTFSVIIPAYNKGRYLKETIDSVLTQPFQDLEIIVVDDGSTDDTAAVAQQYGAQVKYFLIDNDGYQGPGSAINHGLKAATGRYIHCLDGDDLVCPDFYPRVREQFEANTSLGAVATDGYEIDETGAVKGLFKLGHFTSMTEFRLETLFHNPILSSSMVVKRECYDQVGGRRPEFEICDDYELWLRVSEIAAIALIPHPLVKYRIHKGGISQHFEKTRRLDENIVPAYFSRHPLNYFFPVLQQEDTAENRGAAHLKVGEIFLQRHFLAAAVEQMQQALKYIPDSSTCHNNLGVAWYRCGDQARAREHFEKALQLDPANNEARKNLAPLTAAASSRQVADPKATRRQPPGAKLKVLLVAHGFPPHAWAGTELYTFFLAQQLRERGHELRVIYPNFDDQQPLGAISEGTFRGLKVAQLNLLTKDKFMERFKNDVLGEAFRRYLNHMEVDLVHFQHILGLSASPLQVCSRMGLPTVLTVHDAWLVCQRLHLLGSDGRFCTGGPETITKCVQCLLRDNPQLLQSDRVHELYFGLGLRRRYFQEVLQGLDTLLVPSRYIEGILARHGLAHPHTTLYRLGIQPFPVLPWEPGLGPVRFSYLGNINYTKGPDLAIKAINLVKPGRAHLALFGACEDEHYFKKIMELVEDTALVSFEGKYLPRDLGQILSRTDVAVLPSRIENYPTVVRECLHARVPVIAPNIGGVPEIIEDGVNGLLFQPDDHHDLARKLQHFVSDPEEIRAFRQRLGPVRTIEEEVYQLEDIYRDTIARKTGHNWDNLADRKPAADPPPALPEVGAPAPAAGPKTAPAVCEPPALKTPVPASSPDRLKVGFLSVDPHSYACPTLRLRSPLLYLHRKKELTCLPVGEVVGDKLQVVQENLLKLDILIVQRQLGISLPLDTILDHFPGPKPKTVLEMDDALTCLPEHHLEHNFYRTHKSKVEDYLRRVDLITVTTPKLHDLYRSYNAHIEIIPNCLDLKIWGRAGQPSEPGSSCIQETVQILFSGTPTHARDLALIEAALEDILHEFGPRVRLLFWGNISPRLKSHPQVATVHEFSYSYRDYARKLMDLKVDLALVPLEDNVFNRSKSHIKWLEYSICGIPGIYTNLEPYNAWIEPGRTGLLAENRREDWRQAMQELIDHRDLREILAQQAYQEVVEHHTLEQNAHRWLAAYQKLMAPPDTPEISARPLVSIVIPVFNNLDYTRQCLQAVFQHRADSPAFEVIVVDNGSTDGTGEFLCQEQEAGRLKVLSNQENLGFARACNQGAQAAAGELLVFLNNDTVVTPGWLKAMVECRQQDDRIGIVGAKLLYADDTVQHAGVVFSRASLLTHLYRHFYKSHPAVNKEREFQVVTAACLLISKELFWAAGQFDAGYLNGFEDVDLCFQVRHMGYKVMYTPKSEVYHFEGKTPGRFHEEKNNTRLLRRKWLKHMQIDEPKYYQEDGLRKEEQILGDNLVRLEIFDSHENPFWKEAVAWKEQGLLAKAVASYQEALKFNPFDTRTARIAEELAELYESLGNYAEAVKVWQLVAEKDPSPHSHFHLGRAYQHNQNFPEAVQHLEQAKTMLGLPG